jgi:hypothetical protein
MNTEEVKVKTVSQYIDQLKINFQKIMLPDELFCLWFRGEGNAICNTQIVPKAYRDFGGPLNEDNFNNDVYQNAKGIEANIKAAFNRESFRFLARNGISGESWNQYILMQHYGLRTRLLDWTESALLALFFAVKDLGENDGKVWILSPLRLNSFTIEKICGKSFNVMYIPVNVIESSRLLNETTGNLNIDELYRRYLNLEFENFNGEELNSNYYPLAIYPNLLDERMSIQQSCFTIFGNEVNGLLSAEKNTEFLGSILIDATMKRQIKEELKWLGVSSKTMYPDLEGISKSIEDHYNIDHLILKRIN